MSVTFVPAAMNKPISFRNKCIQRVSKMLWRFASSVDFPQ